MLNIFDEINSNQEKISINLKLLKLLKLKLRTLNQKETLNICNYNFSIDTDYINKVKNEIIFISNIKINEFILNITPLGLKKISKNNLLGINEMKQKIREIEEEKERKKEREKMIPPKEPIPGPGER